MAQLFVEGRTRNAAATRQAILDAARARFAHEGYDGVSLREIAGDAGVDAALVSRYFGSKEELFNAVLSATGDASVLLEGGVEGFGARLAGELMYKPMSDAKFECVLVMLRSSASQQALASIRRHSRANFYAPLEALLGGPDAAVRTRLVGAVIMGLTLARALNDDHDLDAAGRERLCARLADILQRAIDP
jgi:AcrR family transcriptional regulator